MQSEIKIETSSIKLLVLFCIASSNIFELHIYVVRLLLLWKELEIYTYIKYRLKHTHR